jgi:hypothetical protein
VLPRNYSYLLLVIFPAKLLSSAQTKNMRDQKYVIFSI